MLFRSVHLKGIKAGKINLAFRKWKKPAVKKDGLQKTAIGQIKIKSVKPVLLSRIKPKDATAAGYETLDKLKESLNEIKEGNIYKIEVEYFGKDPRIALREQTTLTDEAFAILKNKLEKFDRFSSEGDWTMKVLEVIDKHPHTVSTILAEKIGFERFWMKLQIRKLKNLGLTISHEIGYELSPLGKAFLKKIKAK